MPIQIVIFLTKTKLFACEINSNGKAESISIKGNTEIKCEGKKSADELISCLFDALNIDDFSDDNFDIVIIESDADREVIKHLETKCGCAPKFNIISMDKILPVIASGKNLIKVGEDVTVSFADEVYRISCNKNSLVSIDKTRRIRETIELQKGDFGFLFRFVSNAAVFIDKSKLEKANSEILALRNKIKSYEVELIQLRETQKLKSLQEVKEDANAIYQKAEGYFDEGLYDKVFEIANSEVLVLRNKIKSYETELTELRESYETELTELREMQNKFVTLKEKLKSVQEVKEDADAIYQRAEDYFDEELYDKAFEMYQKAADMGKHDAMRMVRYIGEKLL